MSKKIILSTICLFFLAVYLISQGLQEIDFPKKIEHLSSSIPTITESTVSGVISSNLMESVKVRRVIDGDTIELFDGRTVRYIGIDTPETVAPRTKVQCFGKQASERNKELVLDKDIYLEKDVSETDRFGRLLRYAYVEINGEMKMVNNVLVEEGFATSATFPPDIKHQEEFRKSQASAEDKKRGLWEGCQ